MAEKRMLIIPSELARKIDENRGDMSQSEFVEFLINSQFKEDEEEETPATAYATLEELHSFENDIKVLLKNFIEFFINYGLEFGKSTKDLEELTSKLHILEKDLDQNSGKKATIKWK